MIVVTGATGRTGRRVTELLLAKGEQVRAVVRYGDKLAPLLLHGDELLAVNVADVDSMAAGFADVSAVYLVLPEDLSQTDLRAHQESNLRFLCRGNLKSSCPLRRESKQHGRSAFKRYRAHCRFA